MYVAAMASRLRRRSSSRPSRFSSVSLGHKMIGGGVVVGGGDPFSRAYGQGSRTLTSSSALQTSEDFGCVRHRGCVLESSGSALCPILLLICASLWCIFLVIPLEKRLERGTGASGELSSTETPPQPRRNRQQRAPQCRTELESVCAAFWQAFQHSRNPLAPPPRKNLFALLFTFTTLGPL